MMKVWVLAIIVAVVMMLVVVLDEAIFDTYYERYAWLKIGVAAGLLFFAVVKFVLKVKDPEAASGEVVAVDSSAPKVDHYVGTSEQYLKGAAPF